MDPGSVNAVVGAARVVDQDDQLRAEGLHPLGHGHPRFIGTYFGHAEFSADRELDFQGDRIWLIGHWGTDLTTSFEKATMKQRVTHFTEELPFLSEDDKDWIMVKSIMEKLGWT
ncbi:MAG: hypothetical protein EXS40_04095 [Opitutaceae bacterium]|nr:hypothetical protein [Opitutaceae bacterium]